MIDWSQLKYLRFNPEYFYRGVRNFSAYIPYHKGGYRLKTVKLKRKKEVVVFGSEIVISKEEKKAIDAHFRRSGREGEDREVYLKRNPHLLDRGDEQLHFSQTYYCYNKREERVGFNNHFFDRTLSYGWFFMAFCKKSFHSLGKGWDFHSLADTQT